nr:hypothetical protein [Saprospiraceae bacterium]
VITIAVSGQSPTKFRYQAVARDINNQPYANTPLRVKFSILEGSANGLVRYSEETTVTTSELGVFDAVIGGGTVLSGSMNQVRWDSYEQYIRVEINKSMTGGNYIVMGTLQLLSVPYAMFANSSGGGGDDSQQLSLSGNELSISNGNSVNLPENTQYLNVSGNELSITDGNTITLPDNTQFLNLSGNQLSITNGNSVTLPTSGQGYFESAGGNDITNNNNGIVFISGSAYQQLFVSGDNGSAAIYAQNNGGGPAINADGGSGTGIIASTTGNGFAIEANCNGCYYALQVESHNNNGPVRVIGSGNTGITSDGYIFGDFNTGISTSGQLLGIFGYSPPGWGGRFVGTNGADAFGDIIGVRAEGATGVDAESTNPNGYSGWFKQRLHADIMEKGSGSFKIDHPLDPANKYLYHSFVESPDMMNVYNGNIVTDQEGRAVVTLPNYFEALNKDFRYQLTCLGSFAQVFIEKKIENNTFIIKADKAGVEISWQVTGIRKDAHADKYRIQPEVHKEDENKGKYLCPTCFGQPETMGERYKDRTKEEEELKALKEKRKSSK